MPSKFEDVFLRKRQNENEVRTRLLDLFELDNASSLRTLRLVSKPFNDVIQHRLWHLFRHIYIHAPLPGPRDMYFLRALVSHCHVLTISVGYEAIAQEGRRVSLPTPTHTRTNSDDSYRPRWSAFWRSRSNRPAGNDQQSPPASPLSTHRRSSSSNVSLSTPPTRMTSFETTKKADAQQQWIDFFSCFNEINTLTIRTNGDPGWQGHSEIEEELVNIRLGLEHAKLPQLRTLRLRPIHAMGILALRWYGFSAHSEAEASTRAVIWQRLETFDLTILNPLTIDKLSESQKVMFKKILYDYLSRFSQTLKCLRLVWLNGDGPSPLALHDAKRPPIHFPKLEELWLGNIRYPHHTIQSTPQLAPKVSVLKSLRSTRSDTSVEPSDSSAWMEVILGRRESAAQRVFDRASSVYSQEARPNSSQLMESGRSSQNGPFFLEA